MYNFKLASTSAHTQTKNNGNYEDMSKVDWSPIIRENQGITTSYDSLLCMLGNLRDKYIPTEWLDGSKYTSTIQLVEDENVLVRKKRRTFQRNMETGLNSQWLD